MTKASLAHRQVRASTATQKSKSPAKGSPAVAVAVALALARKLVRGVWIVRVDAIRREPRERQRRVQCSGKAPSKRTARITSRAMGRASRIAGTMAVQTSGHRSTTTATERGEWSVQPSRAVDRQGLGPFFAPASGPASPHKAPIGLVFHLIEPITAQLTTTFRALAYRCRSVGLGCKPVVSSKIIRNPTHDTNLSL